MQISPNSWHYKIYVFNTQLCRAWLGKQFFYEEPGASRIGLCPYMRMILIWGPLVMLTYLVPLGALFGVFFYMPFAAAGWQAILLTAISFVGGAALFVGLIWCIFKYSEYKEDKKSARREAELERKYNNLPETFGKVFKEYLVSLKTKICPVIEVQKDGE